MLAALSLVLLILFWWGRNAVWGGLTGGIIIGLIISAFFFFQIGEFDWNIVVKSGIIGTLIGFGAELLGRMGNLLKRN